MTPYECIFFDLDGVVADWTGGTIRLIDPEGDPESIKEKITHYDAITDYYQKKFNVTRETADKIIWDAIEAAGEQFWANLPILMDGYHAAREAIDYANNHKTGFMFLTTAANHPTSAHGKVLFLNDLRRRTT